MTVLSVKDIEKTMPVGRVLYPEERGTFSATQWQCGIASAATRPDARAAAYDGPKREKPSQASFSEIIMASSAQERIATRSGKV